MSRCLVCQSNGLQFIREFSELPRVASDGKPIGCGGELAQCISCGAIQRPVNQAFLDQIASIYANYEVYHQGGGAEQAVFEANTGGVTKRSDVLTDRLWRLGVLAEKGIVLDVGCGNGTFLSAFARRFPAWDLVGMELDRRNEPVLCAIPRFRELLVGDVKDLREAFDLVAMIHALEHMLKPRELLGNLAEHGLGQDGLLFIEVPDVAENPFDLIVADHVIHFTPATLARLLANCGYAVMQLTTDWVKKEVSCVARPGSSAEVSPAKAPDAGRLVRWLGEVAAAAIDAGPSIGLFGTATAALWLSQVLGDRIAFYVDEDVNRVGRHLFGKPIVSPDDIPNGAKVFVGVAPAIAAPIGRKLHALGVDFCLPPAIEPMVAPN